MTDTLEPVAAAHEEDLDQEQLAQQLLAQAKEQGVELVGPDGLLNQLTKRVLETALEEEMSEHLGYDKHDPVGRNRGNSRNGVRSKTVLTEIGPVEIDVPRDIDASFDPQIVKKRQRRLTGVDEIVLSLTARGLTTGEVSAHLAEVYGAHVGKDQVSRITEAVVAGLNEWQNRPLDPVYPVIFIDAIVVKVRDGQVTNKPFYVVIGVTTAGERDILGIWAGDGNEGAKYWLAVLTELKTRGVADVCIVVCDGLKGLPDAITTTWPLAAVQTCVIHLLRNTFRYAGRHDWDAMAKDLRPVYTAVNAAHAEQQFQVFADRWAGKYPAAVKLWRSAWTEFIPFLDYGACCEIACGRSRRRRGWLSNGAIAPWAGSRRRGAVDPLQVVGRGSEVELACCGVQAASGELVEDSFDVADDWLDGGATAFVQGGTFPGSEPVVHRLAGRGTCRGWPAGWLGGGGLGLVSPLRQGDEPLRSGSGQVRVAGVASIGQHGSDLVREVVAGGGVTPGGGQFRGVHHRRQQRLVGGGLADRDRGDQVIGGHRQLGVVALKETLAGRHDP